MADVLTQNESAMELAEAWEHKAAVIEEWNPDSDIARTMRRCAESIRRWAQETAPAQVPLSVVRQRTGWSDSWLQERARELEARGLARKRDRIWWIDREAAMDIPVKRGHRPSFDNVRDLEDLSDRILALSGS